MKKRSKPRGRNDWVKKHREEAEKPIPLADSLPPWMYVDDPNAPVSAEQKLRLEALYGKLLTEKILKGKVLSIRVRKEDILAKRL